MVRGHRNVRSCGTDSASLETSGSREDAGPTAGSSAADLGQGWKMELDLEEGKQYSARAVAVLALLALVCGAKDVRGISDWAHSNEAWLGELLNLPHGVPPEEVLLTVLTSLEPVEIERQFMVWVERVRVAQRTRLPLALLEEEGVRRTIGVAEASLPLDRAWLWVEGDRSVLSIRSSHPEGREKADPRHLLSGLRLDGALVVGGGSDARQWADAAIAAGAHFLVRTPATSGASVTRSSARLRSHRAGSSLARGLGGLEAITFLDRNPSHRVALTVHQQSLRSATSGADAQGVPMARSRVHLTLLGQMLPSKLPIRAGCVLETDLAGMALEELGALFRRLALTPPSDPTLIEVHVPSQVIWRRAPRLGARLKQLKRRVQALMALEAMAPASSDGKKTPTVTAPLLFRLLTGTSAG